MTIETIDRPMLPRADVLMTWVLLGLMGAMDIAALAVGLERPAKLPALVVMPGTVGLLGVVFAISLRSPAFCLKVKGTDGARVAGAFMGKTLVMMAITLTVFHAGLLGFETGLIDRSIGGGFLRVYMAALGFNLAFMGNTMAKVMTSRVAASHGPRFHAWGATVSGLGLVITAIAAPEDRMTPIAVTLAMVPLCTGLALAIINKRRRNAD